MLKESLINVTLELHLLFESFTRDLKSFRAALWRKKNVVDGHSRSSMKYTIKRWMIEKSGWYSSVNITEDSSTFELGMVVCKVHMHEVFRRNPQNLTNN